MTDYATGQYDVLDENGDPAAVNCVNRPVAINPYFRVERAERSENADPKAPRTTCVFRGDELLMKLNCKADVYLSFDRLYVWQNAEQTLTRYDLNGTVLEVRKIVSAEGENEVVAFRDDSGENWAVRDEIYPAEPTNVSGACRAEEALLAFDENPDFRFGNRLTDVFGNEHGFGFEPVCPTDYDGIYVTQSKDKRGIMGQDGNWIWVETIYEEENGDLDSP